ncbi:MAG: sodium:calcium antiporter [Deltaproteobacteria bacterium]|nr:sodium:calcium antiporter [Deltaproteobacteria bacterium]
MAELMHAYLMSMPTLPLFVILFISVAVLARAADIMVEQAMVMAALWHLPPVIVGATIVSFGTTLPEVVVSVLAALRGSPGIALGNAAGSVICDTGLILGLAASLAPLPLDRSVVNRQGWIQVFAVLFLVVLSVPFADPLRVFTEGGHLPAYGGYLLLFCLLCWLCLQIRWGMMQKAVAPAAHTLPRHGGLSLSVFLLLLSFAFLAFSSDILISTASELAKRFSISESVVAVTLVAFGTSLPELVTAIAAVRKGHGGIALGNIIGADILNIFLVAGASVAVNPEGMTVGPEFFVRSFPFMLAVIGIFRVGISLSGKHLKRQTGLILLGTYLLLMFLNVMDAIRGAI